MITSLTCPVCGVPLYAEPCGERQLVFCGNGPCPSIAANEGGEGATLEEARHQLCLLVEQELEQNKEVE